MPATQNVSSNIRRNDRRHRRASDQIRTHGYRETAPLARPDPLSTDTAFYKVELAQEPHDAPPA